MAEIPNNSTTPTCRTKITIPGFFTRFYHGAACHGIYRGV